MICVCNFFSVYIGYGDYISPCIIGIMTRKVSAAPIQILYIAAHIADCIYHIFRSILNILYACKITEAVVVIIEFGCTTLFIHQLIADILIGSIYTVYLFIRTQAICIILIACRCTVTAQRA